MNKQKLIRMLLECIWMRYAMRISFVDKEVLINDSLCPKIIIKVDDWNHFQGCNAQTIPMAASCFEL